MNLVLLHGPGILNSRQKLTQIKKGFNASNVVIFENGVDLQTVLATLMTTSLLPEEQLIILENLPEDFNYILTSIPLGEAASSAYTLVIWFDHEVDIKKPIYKFVSDNKGEIILFPEGKEVSVFPFLDTLGFKDYKAYLELEKLKKSGAQTQYLITMVLYLLRSLASPSKKSPKFVIDKILKQQQNFPADKIKELYKFILETDFKIKSGLLENKQAEFMLVDKFID